MKRYRIRSALRVIGDIFIPLLPGIICAGLCGGFATLIAQAVPNYAESSTWAFIYQILRLINTAMMTFLTAWAGYRAAERFGGTPILGGMLGMITSLDGINEIASIMGLYNSAVPLDSVLCSGKGGVLAVIAGALLIAYVEKSIRTVMPKSIDIVPGLPVRKYIHPGDFRLSRCGVLPAAGGCRHAPRLGCALQRPAVGAGLCHALSGPRHGRRRAGWRSARPLEEG